MELITVTEYGRRIDRSRQTIYKWAKAGMPMVEGKIDLEAAEAWRLANRPVEGASQAAQQRVESSPVTPALPGALISGLTAARTEREEIKAQREKLKLKTEEGELVPAAEVREIWAAVITKLQTRLLLVPEKLPFEREQKAIVDREIRSALTVLSTEIAELAA